ncbi:hypothetical protein BH24ACT15_BH24ACT15_14570 [soil metagenome]|jgi:predicted DNA-binding protein
MVKQTMVHLTEELIERADAEARKRSVSRSALIREALGAFLADSTDAAIDRRMQQGYDAIPQATTDDWGDLASLADRSTRELMKRLAVEERAAGADSW